MAYIEEFRLRAGARDLHNFLQLWYEYCQGDIADPDEIQTILAIAKQSDIAKEIGKHVEDIIPLIEQIEDAEKRFLTWKALFDVETTNSEKLAKIAKDLLEQHFGSDPRYMDKLRLVGLRGSNDFQGAISNMLLLNHLQKGAFVYHEAGWGVGEILDFSYIREQVTIDFENVYSGKKDISFQSAFKSVIPVNKTHFLVQRFSDPDALEAKAKKDPVGIIKEILTCLGPKNAEEIKDLLLEYVIPEEEYTKWWQLCRTKLKKDDHIATPKNLQGAYTLRDNKLSIEDRVKEAFSGKSTNEEIVVASYNLIRDFPEAILVEHARNRIEGQIRDILKNSKVLDPLKMQCYLLLESFCGDKESTENHLKELTLGMTHISAFLLGIDILAFKKRVLEIVKRYRTDWATLFLEVFVSKQPMQIREYLFKELLDAGQQEEVKKSLRHLMERPHLAPEIIVWYMQKICEQEAPFFSESKEKSAFFESFLILLSIIEKQTEYRDLAKKMYAMITAKRFALIRKIFKEATIDEVQEFLLLFSKCTIFSGHDQSNLVSLAGVAHPEIAKKTKNLSVIEEQVIWTTVEAYEEMHERIKHLGTAEMVDNAREIEEARSHGDLRENADYKAAKERRARIQRELKDLSDQFRIARVITKEDVKCEEVGIGNRVSLKNSSGQEIIYTILGPWDANPEKYVLSISAPFVQAMVKKKIGDKFVFNDNTYTVTGLGSYFEQEDA